MKIERYAAGKWDVFSDAPYPVRIGHIVGGNGRYCAERGPVTLGCFESKREAIVAIAEVEFQAMTERGTV